MLFTKMIKKRGTFKYLLNKGICLRGEYLSLYYRKTNNNYNTFGVCVSKKNGNSVRRNKFKRWVREVYKINEEFLGKKLDIVVILKKEVLIENLNYLNIKNDLEGLINNIKKDEKNN